MPLLTQSSVGNKQKEEQARLRKLENEIKKIEAEIEKLENENEELTELLQTDEVSRQIPSNCRRFLPRLKKTPTDSKNLWNARKASDKK